MLEPQAIQTGCLAEMELLHFAQGVLSESAAARLEVHLDQCAGCRRTLAAFARAGEEILSPSTAATPSSEPSAPEAPLLVRGQTVGRYVVLDCIGAGGMGVVYAAYDPELDRKVALKLLRRARRQARSDARARLAREAQAMARLSHPNVVGVHDVGELQGQLFVAMELVEGGTVSRWLAGRPRSWREILALFLAAGEGLAAAHAAGLVHRDFKPSNVLVGKDDRARVTDFGLARAVSAEPPPEVPTPPPELAGSALGTGEPLTLAGATLGTPAYFAPEQFDRGAADAKTDQFSFAVSLYEALYGERPFAGETLRALARAVRAGAVRPPPRGARVPPHLRRILLRALSPDPQARYPSMAQLLSALRRDPGRSKARIAALVASAGLAALVSSAGVVRARQRGEAICSGGAERLSTAWGPERGRALREAFERSGAPYAASAADGVTRALSAYGQEWVALHRGTCEATRLRAEQSEELLDLKMRCLDRRLRELSALTGIFLQADRAVVERARQAVSALAPVEGCADSEGVLARVPPPETPQLAAQVEAERARHAELWALATAGKYAQGVALAKERTAAARLLEYKPLLAEALLLQAKLLDAAGDFKAAEQAMLESVDLAEASRHDELTAKVWTDLVFNVGYRQSRHDEAHQWARRARAAILRLGGDDLLESTLLNTVGGVLQSQGRFDEAIDHYRRSLALKEAKLGPEHTDVAMVVGNLGIALGRIGKFEEALAFHRRAIASSEKIFGPDHPQVATALNNLCTVLDNMGRPEEALPLQDRALKIRERALGPEHPLLATSFNNQCVVLGALGRTEEALPLCRRARAIIEKTLGPQSSRVAILLNSEAAALAHGERHAEALALYERALALREQSLGPTHPDLVADLVGIGQEKVALRQLTQAVAPLERALALHEAHGGVPGRAGDARLALAQALWPSPAARPRARTLAAQAADDFARAGPGWTKRLEALRRWEAAR